MPGVEITWEEMLFDDEENDTGPPGISGNIDWEPGGFDIEQAWLVDIGEHVYVADGNEIFAEQFNPENRWRRERDALREALENMLDAAEACGNGEPDCPTRYHQATKAARAALEALTDAA